MAMLYVETSALKIKRLKLQGQNCTFKESLKHGHPEEETLPLKRYKENSKLPN